MQGVKKQVLKRPASSSITSGPKLHDVRSLVNNLSNTDCKRLLVDAAARDEALRQRIHSALGSGPPERLQGSVIHGISRFWVGEGVGEGVGDIG